MKSESKPVMKPEANLRRRSFLLTASVGSAGAVAAAVAAHAPLLVETDTHVAVPESKASGYQPSDHVLQYYRSTRT